MYGNMKKKVIIVNNSELEKKDHVHKHTHKEISS